MGQKKYECFLKDCVGVVKTEKMKNMCFMGSKMEASELTVYKGREAMLILCDLCVLYGLVQTDLPQLCNFAPS